PAVVLLLALGVLAGLAGGGALDDADPGMRSVRAEVNQRTAPNARVTLEIAAGSATLVAERLPEPPRGRVYQVWVKRPNLDPEPTSTLFAPRADGSAAAAVPGSLEGMEAVLVTHEPAGGSPRPTSQPILQVSPRA
ncbi:MAG: anti-sigma factor, partial [Solirubrobacterales bacterium]|nr:anti-sigma factor [Solirubrobacterales bacterium]